MTTPATPAIGVEPTDHIYFTVLASKQEVSNRFKESAMDFTKPFGPLTLDGLEAVVDSNMSDKQQLLALDLIVLKDGTHYKIKKQYDDYKSGNALTKAKLFCDWILPGRYWRCIALLRTQPPRDIFEKGALEQQILEIQDKAMALKALLNPAPVGAPVIAKATAPVPESVLIASAAPAPATAPKPEPEESESEDDDADSVSSINSTKAVHLTRKKPSTKVAIMLDFDGTIAEKQSGGKFFTDTHPMDEQNKEIFYNNLQAWLKKGHDVAIITRAISENIIPYLESKVLNNRETVIKITKDGYIQGQLSVYGPTEDEFNDNLKNKEYWPQFKVDKANSFIGACKKKHVLFADDDRINVETMEGNLRRNGTLQFEAFIAQTTKTKPVRGDYVDTFNKVNDAIERLKRMPPK